ncbi:MAG: ABC transporter permease, partial [Chitinophagaceae bacterium]
MNLLISFRSEMLKTKRSATFYVTMAAAAIIPTIFLFDLIADGINSDSRKDPLNGIFKMGFEMLTLAILPIFVVALCTLLPQIEFRNNTWKQLHASPQTKANVFIAKYLQVHSLILLLLVSFNVFMAVVILVANFISPALKLFDTSFNSSAW